MTLALTPAQDCLARHRVRVFGDGRRTLVLGPEFGCQQLIWEQVALELARDHRMEQFGFHLDHAQPDDQHHAAGFQARLRHHDPRALRESLAA